MNFECQLENGQHLEIDNEGDRTLVSFGYRSEGQQQSQGHGLTTGKWSKKPVAYRTVELVEPTGDPCNEVRFGTTVTVREKDGNEQTYRILGLDETDVDRGWVSWLSPIAKALIGSRVGERVRFRFPVGEKELTIIKIS